MTGAMRWAAAALAVAAASAVGVAPANAETPAEFTITEEIDFESGGPQSFTATGPLCASGTFVDEPQTFAAYKGRSGHLVILIDTVYTCDDGSGSFNALKQILITFTGEDSSTNSGPIILRGGTGDYVGLVGHGRDLGEASGTHGTGTITGYVVR
ncbi:hypothetical protein GCM10028789_28600 [Sinomonas halotolerans]